MWVGRTTISDEHILLTDKGVMKTRCVKRFAEEKDRLNKSVLEKVRGLPWEPTTDEQPPPVARDIRPDLFKPYRPVGAQLDIFLQEIGATPGRIACTQPRSEVT